MLSLLSKIKDLIHQADIDLINASLTDDCIKLSCCVNGQRNTELNIYIKPVGDKFEFSTISPCGDKSTPKLIDEVEILPTMTAVLNPNKESTVEVAPKVEVDPDAMDEVTIEVADGVFDKKLSKHGVYANSRYAYSDKYHKMGTIVEIRKINSNKKSIHSRSRNSKILTENMKSQIIDKVKEYWDVNAPMASFIKILNFLIIDWNVGKEIPTEMNFENLKELRAWMSQNFSEEELPKVECLASFILSNPQTSSFVKEFSTTFNSRKSNGKINWDDYKGRNINPAGGIYECPVLVLKNFDTVIKNIKDGKEDWSEGLAKEALGAVDITDYLEAVMEDEAEYFWHFDEDQVKKLIKAWTHGRTEDWKDTDGEPMHSYQGPYGFSDIITEKQFNEVKNKYPKFNLTIEKLPADAIK